MLTLTALRLLAADPPRVEAFWAELLGWEALPGRVVRADGFGLSFVRSPVAKTGKNPTHLDLTSTSLEDQQQTVARALRLGAKHIDVGQSPQDQHVVLADPEGNEFCVIEPGNRFLAGCGFLGCVVGDGSQRVGYFWSEALGWPLVWDRDGETAVQSPDGGTKLSWGGEDDVRHETEPRLRFELEAVGDLAVEVERLVSLGATLITHTAAAAVLTDPDGCAFQLLA